MASFPPSPRAADVLVLAKFVEIWCADHHSRDQRERWKPPRVITPMLGDAIPVLCPGCIKLLGYSIGRLLVCRHNPKPACKSCSTPCYRPDDRDAMRAVMRYSGWRLLCRGHLWLAWKYFF